MKKVISATDIACGLFLKEPRIAKEIFEE